MIPRRSIEPVTLTEKEFSRHLNSRFRLTLQDQSLELELIEVKAYLPQANAQGEMERFSIFFDGPGISIFLNASTALSTSRYPSKPRVEHFLLAFVVAIGENGMRRELMRQDFSPPHRPLTSSHFHLIGTDEFL
jgi:hypothetical protein